jgi:hypothetical protein
MVFLDDRGIEGLTYVQMQANRTVRALANPLRVWMTG